MDKKKTHGVDISSCLKNIVHRGKNIYFTGLILALAFLEHQTSHSQNIIYCATRGKEIYFASVKFDNPHGEIKSTL